MDANGQRLRTIGLSRRMPGRIASGSGPTSSGESSGHNVPAPAGRPIHVALWLEFGDPRFDDDGSIEFDLWPGYGCLTPEEGHACVLDILRSGWIVEIRDAEDQRWLVCPETVRSLVTW